MARVDFDRLQKVYPNGQQALIDFTLGIDDGELLVLVGPSGCGKSTLLRLVAGLEPASGGAIRIGGCIVNDQSAQQRNTAMVFQDYALYPTMTVRGNLEFPLKMRRLSGSERERRIQWVSELLALTEVLDRLPKELSGGQRQRVAMGRALVREPSVFLLDEPLSNLDAKLRAEVRAEIVELQRRTGSTMIYVTHDQVEAMTMGHRIAALDHGRLQQAGTPKELYEHPANIFVAGFIGSPAMNLLPADELLRAAQDAGIPDLGETIGWPPLPLSAGEAQQRITRLTAGVRPEVLSVTSGERRGLPAVVTETEYLGHETLVHFQLGSDRPNTERPSYIARLGGMQDFRCGQPVRVGFTARSIAWFDERGEALAQ